MEKITSKTNNFIKQAAKLSASGAARKRDGRFILEGVRLCCDVLTSDVRPEVLLVTEECMHKNNGVLEQLVAQCKKTYCITAEIAGKLSDTVNPQGVFCICPFRDNQMKLSYQGKYIVLDHVQDPANLGAIIRSAEAIGVDGALIGGGADLYNPKALRASMGSILRLPVLFTDRLPEQLSEMKAGGMKILAAVPDRAAEPVNHMQMGGGVAAVVGNEANGISPQVLGCATHRVTIPMGGRAESLNAATAAAILIWEMMRGNSDEA